MAAELKGGALGPLHCDHLPHLHRVNDRTLSGWLMAPLRKGWPAGLRGLGKFPLSVKDVHPTPLPNHP